jgi:hypothetical protein
MDPKFLLAPSPVMVTWLQQKFISSPTFAEQSALLVQSILGLPMTQQAFSASVPFLTSTLHAAASAAFLPAPMLV